MRFLLLRCSGPEETEGRDGICTGNGEMSDDTGPLALGTGTRPCDDLGRAKRTGDGGASEGKSGDESILDLSASVRKSTLDSSMDKAGPASGDERMGFRAVGL